jgi:hypothetical protein
MHRNGRLHTYFRFPVSIQGALARLESAEGPLPPLGEKKRNEMIGQSSTFGWF